MCGLRAAVSLTCQIWNPVTNLVSSSTRWILNSKLVTTTICSQQVTTWTNSGLKLTQTLGNSVTISEGPASNRTKEALSLWLTLISNNLSLTLNMEWTQCNNKCIPIRWWTSSSNSPLEWQASSVWDNLSLKTTVVLGSLEVLVTNLKYPLATLLMAWIWEGQLETTTITMGLTSWSDRTSLFTSFEKQPLFH
jgi:hypothetical protein